MNMKMVVFDFEPKLLREFIGLSWKVHKEDPFWIPPFEKKILKQLSPRNSFFTYGEIENFMVLENKDVLGRISAIVNRKAIENGEQIGFLGFFECIDDFSVAEKLLSESTEYLYQRGIRKIRGPINFSTWHTYRFMTQGFETLPFFLEPFNPPYYPSFFERYGIQKVMTYFSNLLENYEHQIQNAEVLRQKFFASGHTVRQIDLNSIHSELRLLYELSTRSVENSCGYTEISFSEFSGLYDGFQRLIDPELVLFAYNSNRKPIGFIFCIPNFAEAIRRMDRKTSLYAKLKLANRRADALIIKTMGVIPEARQSGVGSALMALMHKTAKRKRYSKVIHALMRGDNTVIRKMSERGGKIFKEYAVYELTL